MPEQPYNLPKYQHRRTKLYNWAVRFWLPVSIHRWNKVFIDRKTAIENSCLNDISINTTTEFRPQNFSYFLQTRQSLNHWILGPFNSITVEKKLHLQQATGCQINVNNSTFLYIYIFFEVEAKKDIQQGFWKRLRGREILQLCSHLC